MLLPLDLVERIEIVYGPSALLYGGYSLYGIVNVITRNGSSMPGGRVRLSGGSWATGEAVASWGASGTYGADPLMSREWSVLAAAGYYTTARGPRSPARGRRLSRRSPGRDDLGRPAVRDGLRAGPVLLPAGAPGRLLLLGRAGYRKRGTPFAPYGAMYGTGDQTLRDEKEFVDLRWDHAMSSGLGLSARAFYDVYHYHEVDPYADAVTYPGQLVTSSTSGRATTIGARSASPIAAAPTSSREAASTATAASGQRHGTSSSTARPPRGFRSGRLRAGRFGVLYAPGGMAAAGPDLVRRRGELRPQREPGSSKAQPRVAVVYKPVPTLSFKGLYGRGFRPPSIFEASYADYQSQDPEPGAGVGGDLHGGAVADVEGHAFASRPRATPSAAAWTALIRGVTIESPSEQVQGGVVGSRTERRRSWWACLNTSPRVTYNLVRGRRLRPLPVAASGRPTATSPMQAPPSLDA